MRVSFGLVRINRLLNRARASRISKEVYQQLLKHIHLPANPPGVFSYDLEAWRRIIVKFSLYREMDFPDWIPFLRGLELKLISSPSELAELSHADAVEFSDRLQDPALFLQLWHASCVEEGRAGAGGSRIRLDTHASLLAQSLRSIDIDTTPISQTAAASSDLLTLPR